MSLKAIIRNDIPGGLCAGALVYVGAEAFSKQLSGLKFPVCQEMRPEMLFWVSPRDMLPFAQFLRHEPFIEYWMLGHERSMRTLQDRQFLDDPAKQTLGCVGFRFESVGELRYYMASRDLLASAFKILHVKNIDE